MTAGRAGLVLDSGNLLFGEPLTDLDGKALEQQKLKARLIAESHGKMGYDAVNVGEYDVSLGVEFLKSLERAYGVRFVSTNLVDRKGQFLFKPYVIKTVENKRVAIFGVIGRGAVPPSSSVHAADPVESVRRAMSGIKGKADFYIALTQQELPGDKRLAEAVQDLDLILRRATRDGPQPPMKIAKTSIFEIGERGQSLGRIVVGSDKSLPKWEVTEMDEKVGDDPQIRAMIENYNEQIVRLFTPRRRSEVQPLRAQLCSRCHEREYGLWQETGHAKSYESLVQVKREFDPECLRCHTTMFNVPGGFSMRDQPAELRHVQCDACHGQMSKHVSHPREEKPVRRPEVTVCATCHTREHSPGFSETYLEYLQRVECSAQR